MLPAAYLRQKFVRPLLTKDGGITHHRPSAAGDEPSSRHGPVLRFGRGMAQGDGGMRYLFVAYGLELFVFVGAPTLAWFVFFG